MSGILSLSISMLPAPRACVRSNESNIRCEMVRGRPSRIINPVDIHVRIPKDLITAARRPGCSESEAIRKGLQLLIRHEQPDSVEAIGIRIRELKKRIAKEMNELNELRESLTRKGITDLDTFESRFFEDDCPVEAGEPTGSE